MFLVNNLANFSPGYWYKPVELKSRFENHMKFKSNENMNLIDEDDLNNSNSINSKDVTIALKQLEKKIAFKNITKTDKMKSVRRHLKFDGYPSVWDFPSTVNLIKSIIGKRMTLKLIYMSLLKSGLLYNYWRCKFLTILGCLQEVKVEEVDATEQIFQNLFASVPESIKDKLSPDVYIQRVIALRNEIMKLSDDDLIKIAGKFAGYIIKYHPQYTMFGIYLESETE
jgi:hypothetical protein